MKFMLGDDWCRPVVVALGLLVYSNGLAGLAYLLGVSAELTFRYVNPVVLLGLLPFAVREMGGWKGLGIQRKGWLAAVGWGVMMGVGLAGVSILFFANPIVADKPLSYGPITGMGAGELALDLLVRVPVSIALFEEMAFRGVLYGMLKRRLGVGKGIGWSAVAFGLWHAGVTAISVMGTNVVGSNKLPVFLHGWEVPIGVVGGVIATGLAGVAFGWVRERTGSLWGSVAAHWVADGMMIGALWLLVR